MADGSRYFPRKTRCAYQLKNSKHRKTEDRPDHQNVQCACWRLGLIHGKAGRQNSRVVQQCQCHQAECFGCDDPDHRTLVRATAERPQRCGETCQRRDRGDNGEHGRRPTRRTDAHRCQWHQQRRASERENTGGQGKQTAQRRSPCPQSAGGLQLDVRRAGGAVHHDRGDTRQQGVAGHEIESAA